MKIAIYLGKNIGNTVDATHIEKGNPGVGGTQFCMLQLAHYLNTQSDIKVVLLSCRNYLLENGIVFRYVSDDLEVCKVAEEENTDILIIRVPMEIQYQEIIRRSSLKIVIWSHNFLQPRGIKYISETPQIKANVFVGKQMYDRYIDDDVISKSTFIYNMFKDNTPSVNRENDSKTVVYMGALIPEKGFLQLASIWPDIKRVVPEARLKVLGSGKLYGNAVLGEYGLAEASFEKKFMKYLTNLDGTIDDSVEFMGVVGDGKTEIFRKCSVGVVNPSGKSETFGMGVVEMAEAELPVSTIKYGGYIDTVINGKTGYISKNLHGIKKKIIFLLQNKHENNLMGVCAKENIKQFSPEFIGVQWISLLNDVYRDTYKGNLQNASTPYCSQFKYLRVINRFLRFSCKLSFLPSIVSVEYSLRNLIVKLFNQKTGYTSR